MAENKFGIENIKLFVEELFLIKSAGYEIAKKGKRPNFFKRFIEGAKIGDAVYDLIDIFPKVKAEIADLNTQEIADLASFVRLKLKAEASDADIKLGIAQAIDTTILAYQGWRGVFKLLKIKEETEGIELKA